MAPISVYKELIDHTKFKIGDSMFVSVKISNSNTEKFPLPECRACKDKFMHSGVLTSAMRINWSFLNTTTYRMEDEVCFVNL